MIINGLAIAGILYFAVVKFKSNTYGSTAKRKPKLQNKIPKTHTCLVESMLLMRKFEEKAGQLYGMQKYCLSLYIGQEACARSVSALKKGDKYITAYRDHAHPGAWHSRIK